MTSLAMVAVARLPGGVDERSTPCRHHDLQSLSSTNGLAATGISQALNPLTIAKMTGKTTSFCKNLFDFRPSKCRIGVGKLSQLPQNAPGPGRLVKNESFDETKTNKK